jgi:hypothetical protein
VTFVPLGGVVGEWSQSFFPFSCAAASKEKQIKMRSACNDGNGNSDDNRLQLLVLLRLGGSFEYR